MQNVRNIYFFTKSLERFNLSKGNGTSETDVDGMYHLPSGPVGRARRRLNELLEDSFSLFGSRDVRVKEPQPSQMSQAPTTIAADALAVFSETRGKSAHVRYISFFLYFFFS